MIGKNLFKLALGALACLSVAFSGNIKEVLKVDAADEYMHVGGEYRFVDTPASLYSAGLSNNANYAFGFEFINVNKVGYGLLGLGSGTSYQINSANDLAHTAYTNLFYYPSWQSANFKEIRITDLSLSNLGTTFKRWFENNTTLLNAEPSYSSGVVEGYSSGYSAGRSAGYSEGYASGQSAGNSQGYGEGYASGQSAGHSQGYSEGYADGYDSGDSAGYSDGYASGYSAGRNQTLDVEQTVSLVWGGNDPIEVTYSYGEYPANPVTLNGSLSRFDLKRSIGSSMIVRVRCSGNYVATTVLIGGVSTRLVPTMVVNDYVYFPTWDNPILVYVTSTSTPFDGGLMPEDFCFDASEYQNVFFGSYNPNAEVFEKGYNEGYNSGYEAGQDAAQSSVYDAGRSDGYAAGYSAGLEAGGGEQNVIDIWGLMSAVITMPFTFFSQGLDWTLFAGSQYEFSVSIFFGSLLVILMLWKIIQLVIGLGK